MCPGPVLQPGLEAPGCKGLSSWPSSPGLPGGCFSPCSACGPRTVYQGQVTGAAGTGVEAGTEHAGRGQSEKSSWLCGNAQVNEDIGFINATKKLN